MHFLPWSSLGGLIPSVLPLGGVKHLLFLLRNDLFPKISATFVFPVLVTVLCCCFVIFYWSIGCEGFHKGSSSSSSSSIRKMLKSNKFNYFTEKNGNMKKERFWRHKHIVGGIACTGWDRLRAPSYKRDFGIASPLGFKWYHSTYGFWWNCFSTFQVERLTKNPIGSRVCFFLDRTSFQIQPPLLDQRRTIWTWISKSV